MEIRLLMLAFLLFLPSALPVSDNTAFVYKACAPQSLSQSQTLPSLLAQLADQSWYSSFLRSTEIGGMTGVFQCREDMGGEECGRCVNLAAQMCERACGQSAAGARVQLEGCYVQYEMEEWGTGEVLYRECGEANGNGVMMELEGVVEKRVMSMDIVRRGYYRGNYDSVEMMGQCEADLEECECRACFSHALQVAAHQCSASLSARIYLPYCFLAYSYHPIHSFPSGGVNNSSSSSAKRIAAIAVGGGVAVCLALVFLFFLKSRYSKRDYYY